MITITFQIIHVLLDLYRWAVILAAVFSLLVAFTVLDPRNRFVWTVGDFLYRVTEPALRPIRRIMPNFGGGIDISPIILILLITVVQMLLDRIYQAIVYGNISALFI